MKQPSVHFDRNLGVAKLYLPTWKRYLRVSKQIPCTSYSLKSEKIIIIQNGIMTLLGIFVYFFSD